MISQPISHDGIRRHADRSIDYDFYRKSASALRTQTRRDAMNLKPVRIGGIAIAATFALIAGALNFTTDVPQSRSVSAQTDLFVIR